MIPIRGIAVIALLTMQVRVDPCTRGLGDILAGIVRIVPTPRLAEPQRAQGGVAASGRCGIGCCGAGEFFSGDHSDGKKRQNSL